jgi:hypothetical protein
MSKQGMHHDKLVQTYNALSADVVVEGDDLKRIQEVLLGAKEYSRALSNEIKDYIETIEGKFSTKDLYQSLKVSSREEQKHSVVVLGRLLKEGLIERVNGRSGVYRKIDKELNVMDWMGVESSEIYMKFPLSVENFVRIYPKNVILLNGVPNSGKTAYALEMARLNRNLYSAPTRYISTEMGAGELKTRLKLYPQEVISLDSWAKDIQFVERSGDFADIVMPNGFTIIDYVEVYDEFWKVSAVIAEIFKKLDEGVVLIILQKDPNKSYGVGGAMNNWKPRLSMNLDKGMITLTKVKNFRGEVNPDGIYRYFEINDGWQFKQLGDWTK